VFEVLNAVWKGGTRHKAGLYSYLHRTVLHIYEKNM